MTTQEFSQVCQGIGYIFQALGILGAGLYFGYKIWQGYNIIDLSVSAECSRQKTQADNQADKKDYLFVNVDLEKGERGSLRLHDARVRVHYFSSGKSDYCGLRGIDRSQRKSEQAPGEHDRQ